MNSSASSTDISVSLESKHSCTYPTIQELQAEFQEKYPYTSGVYFKNDPSLTIEPVFDGVFDGFGMAVRAQSTWSNFLKQRAYKILAEAGMWSQRLDYDMTCWAHRMTNTLDVRKQRLEGYQWYTTALCMLSNTTMPIEWTGRSSETAFYREAARKQRAGEDDEDDEDDEDEEEEVVAVTVAVPNIEEKKVVTVAVPTVEEEKVVAKTYPTIQELQAEFQALHLKRYSGEHPGLFKIHWPTHREKKTGVEFKKHPDIDVTELVWFDGSVHYGAVEAWAVFLIQHSDTFLKEAGMHSAKQYIWIPRLDTWTDEMCKQLGETKYTKYRRILIVYMWYKHVVRILTDTTDEGLRKQAYYKELTQKQEAAKKEEDSDEDSDEDSCEYSDEEEEDEEEEEVVVIPTVEEKVVVAVPTVQEKKVVAVPTIQEQIDALRRLRYDLQRLNT